MFGTALQDRYDIGSNIFIKNSSIPCCIICPTCNDVQRQGWVIESFDENYVNHKTNTSADLKLVELIWKILV